MGASLHSLPEHLVGHLYSLLPDRESRKAFYMSSKAICHAPSVLHQIFKLIVTEAHMVVSEMDPCSSNPLLTFPRKATLRHLVIQCDDSYSEPYPPIKAMLFPQFEELRLRVQAVFQDVEVLQFEGTNQNEIACKILGKYLREHALSLHTIKFTPDDFPYIFPPVFLEALSAFGGGRNIQHMDLGNADGRHLEALRRGFTSLTSLTIYYVTEDDDLQQLNAALSKLHQLKVLNMNTFTDVYEDTVAALPASLVSISFNMPFINGDGVDCFDFLIELLSCVSSGKLPALRVVTINKADVALEGTLMEETLIESLSLLAECLCTAAPNLRVVVDCLEYGPEYAGFGRFGKVSAIHPALWSVCSILGTHIKNVKFLSARISVADLMKLKDNCPNMEGLHFVPFCKFDNPSGCLSAAMHGLPCLKELKLDFAPEFDPEDHMSYLRGFGCKLLSVSASLSPNRKHLLQFKVNVQTDRYWSLVEGLSKEVFFNAARNELSTMIAAWNTVCGRLEVTEGARQQIAHEVSIDGCLI